MEEKQSLSAAFQFRYMMSKLEPLSVISTKKLYSLLKITSPDERSRARAAFYRHVIGTPVFNNRIPEFTFGVKVQDELDGGVFLTLPGIRTTGLRENNSPQTIELAKAYLGKAYGDQVIKYWMQSAQRRSVDLAATGMKNARKRDLVCRLCHQLQEEYIPDPAEFSVCHLVDRKTVFWRHLVIVHKSLVGQMERPLFTDIGTTTFTKSIKEDKLHSDPRFMVLLCRAHDRMVRGSINQVAPLAQPTFL